ncbi:hypothetical protein ACFL5Z_15460 [Planctomycetota bacterium]
MEDTKETPKRIGIERVFEPGRLGLKCIAAAYERLVPIHRVPLCREPEMKSYDVVEKWLCAL